MELSENESSEKTRKELDPKLIHLPNETKNTITELFLRQKVVALSFRDLILSTVLYHHSFELTYKNPVYYFAGRMAPKHFDVI